MKDIDAETPAATQGRRQRDTDMNACRTYSQTCRCRDTHAERVRVCRDRDADAETQGLGRRDTHGDADALRVVSVCVGGCVGVGRWVGGFQGRNEQNPVFDVRI